MKPETRNQAGLLIYRIIGIQLLKRMIMATIGKFVLTVNPREKMPSYFVAHPFKIDSLKLTLQWMYFNEVVHMVLILICSMLGYSFHSKGYSGGVWIMAGSVSLNIGLVLMQHFNRRRIHRMIEKLGRRNEVGSR